MALITRCPDCATAFRVTPLQLQAHGGEVRCGRCAHVFNGFATLATMQGPEAVELSNDATPDRAESPQAPSPSVSDSIIAALADQEESRATGSETAQPEAASESPVQEAPEPPEPGPPEPEPPAREEPTLQVPHAASAPGNGATEHYIGDDYADNYADDYGFDAPPSRKTSPIWGIASLFLLVVLAAQALYFFRAELSIIAPATRPFLEQYCELLGCTISLPSQRI